MNECKVVFRVIIFSPNNKETLLRNKGKTLTEYVIKLIKIVVSLKAIKSRVPIKIK